MKASVLFIMLCPLLVNGQLRQIQKSVYLTDSLHYFQIKNDSLLEISINNLWCRYSVIGDTLKLKSQAVFENKSYSSELKILVNNPDSLFLTYINFFKSKPDTLNFISVSKRRVEIKDFTFLRIDEFGTWGCKRLILSSDKKLQLSTSCPLHMPNGPVTDLKTFRLTDHEYRSIIDSLANGLVLMLPNSKKATHGFDPTYVNISFEINGKTLYFEDIGLQKFHWRLYKYLMKELLVQKFQENKSGSR